MAIKFSQFVVQTDASTLSHIVGYNGADNIQITPTNFLNSLLTGTAGQVLFYDTTGVTGDNGFSWDNTNKRLGIGTSSPSEKLDVVGEIRLSEGSDYTGISTSGGDTIFANVSSVANNIRIFNGGSEVMRIDSSGNVGIGTTSPSQKLEVVGDIKLGDNKILRLGSTTGGDFNLGFDGNNGFASNLKGDLYIQNFANDKDIIFRSDDGSGGVTNYIQIDGSELRTTFNKTIRLNDAIAAQFGGSNGMQIYHNNSNSVIQNITGNLTIRNDANDKDIEFACDDGSGGVTPYFRLDGSQVETVVFKDFNFEDSVNAKFGSSADLQIYHSGTASVIDNKTGHLYIKSTQTDGDIIFEADNSAGSVIEYFRVDGGAVKTIVSKNFAFLDSVKAEFGDSGDLQIYHDGNNSSYITSTTSDIYLRNEGNNDKTYIQATNNNTIHNHIIIDGSAGETIFSRNTQHLDQVHAQFGTGNDLKIFHNSTDSFIINETGDFYISNQANDEDIVFTCDDGSGGTTEYFRLDGSRASGAYTYTTRPDGGVITFGDSLDLRLWHDPNTNQSYIRSYNNNLYIETITADTDIIFKADDGSGGTAQYFRVDGGAVETRFLKSTRHFDDVGAYFGDSADLQIYHNGSNSFISDTGTGLLVISSNHLQVYNSGISEFMITAEENSAVNLYYNGSKKLETTNTGVKISGVSEYADNTAAIAGGLVVGDVYRTGDDLKIVH